VKRRGILYNVTRIQYYTPNDQFVKQMKHYTRNLKIKREPLTSVREPPTLPFLSILTKYGKEEVNDWAIFFSSSFLFLFMMDDSEELNSSIMSLNKRIKTSISLLGKIK
jgi:hypothetical protein